MQLLSTDDIYFGISIKVKGILLLFFLNKCYLVTTFKQETMKNKRERETQSFFTLKDGLKLNTIIMNINLSYVGKYQIKRQGGVKGY